MPLPPAQVHGSVDWLNSQPQPHRGFQEFSSWEACWQRPLLLEHFGRILGWWISLILVASPSTPASAAPPPSASALWFVIIAVFIFEVPIWIFIISSCCFSCSFLHSSLGFHQIQVVVTDLFLDSCASFQGLAHERICRWIRNLCQGLCILRL